jgi:hypothetical protein
MRSADVRAYLERGWRELEELQASAWDELRRREGATAALVAADELRRFTVAARPDWPDERERSEDLEVHVRVGEWLRRVHDRHGR